MAYLLDTDIYIYHLSGNTRVRDKIIAIGDDEIWLSSISVAELYFGAYKSEKMDKNLYTLQKNIEKLQIHNFNKSAAKIFGRIKAELKKKGTPIADMDLAVASIALSNGLTLVTHNQKHFIPISELLLEDWG